jgi:predicted transcriptional regulator
MKTTIDISDSLLKQVRKLAAARRTTLRAVVESALRDALVKENRSSKKKTLRLHVFRGDGLQAGLSWDDWSRIRDLTYEGRGG